MEYIEGGVTAAKGFKASSAAAGIKYQGRTDMAMIYSDVPCVAAGTFTSNIVKAAPVKWDRQVVYESKHAQAVICNSGIAMPVQVCREWLTAKQQQRRLRKSLVFRKMLYWWHPQVLSVCS